MRRCRCFTFTCICRFSIAAYRLPLAAYRWLLTASRLPLPAYRLPQVIVITTSCLSVLGATLIILSYVIWADTRAVSRKLLVYLSVCDLFTATFNLVGVLAGEAALTDDGQPSTLCQVQSVITSYSSVASFLWTTAIAVFLYVSVVRGSPEKAKASVKYLHVSCWLLPAIAVGAAMSGE